MAIKATIKPAFVNQYPSIEWSVQPRDIRVINIRSIHKRFGSLNAVNGVSFEVHRQETFGLLGPNGAGKTTTINMIIGALQPDDGDVTINGLEKHRSADVGRMIGVAPQSLSLYDGLTAQENLTFFAKLYGLKNKALHERVDWALEFAGLTDRRRGRVKTFSGGMRRRLNLAAALVHDPQIILLDEPTVGVDPQSRNHIFESIDQLKQQGRTILYTTHYMEEAQRLCDRVAIMDRGIILDIGGVDDLIARHGGQAVVKATLQRVPENTDILPSTLDDLSLRFETDEPLEDIGRLASAGVTFCSLEIARPDLESVFLTLTGRSLRD